MFFCIFLSDLVCARLKSDGVTPKYVKLFGNGFLHLIDHYFWYLPFSSMKSGHSARTKAGVTDTDWETRWSLIVAEHDSEGAREQLAEGWKAWLEEQFPRMGGSAGADCAVAVGGIEVIPD